MEIPQNSPQSAPVDPKTAQIPPVKHKGGRLDKRRDPALVKRLIDAVLAGNTYTNATALAGINYRTFMLWMAEGRALADSNCHKDNFKAQIFHSIKEAESKAIHRNVMVIQRAARKQWQAAAWYLERRLPNEWGRHERIEQVGAGGGPIQVKDVTPLPQLTNERLRKLIALAEGREEEVVVKSGNGNGNGQSTEHPVVAGRA